MIFQYGLSSVLMKVNFAQRISYVRIVTKSVVVQQKVQVMFPQYNLDRNVLQSIISVWSTVSTTLEVPNVVRVIFTEGFVLKPNASCETAVVLCLIHSLIPNLQVYFRLKKIHYSIFFVVFKNDLSLQLRITNISPVLISLVQRPSHCREVHSKLGKINKSISLFNIGKQCRPKWSLVAQSLYGKSCPVFGFVEVVGGTGHSDTDHSGNIKLNACKVHYLDASWTVFTNSSKIEISLPNTNS